MKVTQPVHLGEYLDKMVMTEKQAKEILGDRATWELLQMKKALSMLPIFNSNEDNLRLEAVKVLLKKKK